MGDVGQELAATVTILADDVDALLETFGHRVELEGQLGELRRAGTERIRGDCVFMVHGFGHTAKGMAPRFRKGASDASLVTRYTTDPVMGGNGMNVNFVTLEPEA